MIFGLYMCFTILKIMLCDSEEAPDFGEMAEDGDMLQSMNFKFKNFDIFKERIRNLVVFVKDNNFISKQSVYNRGRPFNISSGVQNKEKIQDFLISSTKNIQHILNLNKNIQIKNCFQKCILS